MALNEPSTSGFGLETLLGFIRVPYKISSHPPPPDMTGESVVVVRGYSHVSMCGTGFVAVVTDGIGLIASVSNGIWGKIIHLSCCGSAGSIEFKGCVYFRTIVLARFSQP
jgi:hypothetical protein